MNLPNLLTISRIILTLPVLLLLTTGNTFAHYLSAFVFAVAALTDFFDGRIARKRGMVTDLGKFLDQISDKILVTSVFLGFMALSKVSVWLLFVIVFRDTIVSGIRMLASSQGRVIAADIFGKAKTAVQMAFIVLLYTQLLWGFPDQGATVWLEFVVAVITLISGFNYLLKNMQIFERGQ